MSEASTRAGGRPDLERLLRTWNGDVSDSGLVRELRRRRWFMATRDKLREKRAAALRRSRKAVARQAAAWQAAAWQKRQAGERSRP